VRVGGRLAQLVHRCVRRVPQVDLARARARARAGIRVRVIVRVRVRVRAKVRVRVRVRVRVGAPRGRDGGALASSARATPSTLPSLQSRRLR
jgi:hypothetical protein